jgi:hypothetical protein
MDGFEDNEDILFKGTTLNSELMIDKIITYRDENNICLLMKFNLNYLVSAIEKDKISLIEKSFKEFDKKGVDIIDFVRVFLNIVEHQDNETLYLIMALIDFFRVISENLNMATFIKYTDVTNFICEVDFLLKKKTNSRIKF